MPVNGRAIIIIGEIVVHRNAYMTNEHMSQA
jgi:hypothetical protein